MRFSLLFALETQLLPPPALPLRRNCHWIVDVQPANFQHAVNQRANLEFEEVENKSKPATQDFIEQEIAVTPGDTCTRCTHTHKNDWG